MVTVERIRQIVQQLPESQQVEVLRYAESLQRNRQDSPESPPQDADSVRNAELAVILERLAALPQRGIPEDPVAWQRAERKERDLPSR